MTHIVSNFFFSSPMVVLLFNLSSPGNFYAVKVNEEGQIPKPFYKHRPVTKCEIFLLLFVHKNMTRKTCILPKVNAINKQTNNSVEIFASNACKLFLLQHVGLLIKSNFWNMVFLDFDSFQPLNILVLILYDLKMCSTLLVSTKLFVSF